MIEEIDTLPREIQTFAFEQAKEWLASSESPDIKPRLRATQKKIVAQRRSESQPADVREVLFNKSYDLKAELLKLEHGLISETLARSTARFHTQQSCSESAIRHSRILSKRSTRIY